MNLYDYGARFYDPRLCSWTSQDPLADKYYGVSSYVYCGNNPIIYIDPSGKDWYLINNEEKIEIHYTKLTSQQELNNAGIEGHHLSKAVVVFMGSYDEKLGEGDNLYGEGAKLANVTVYGDDGEVDVRDYLGYTMTSDPNLFGVLADGTYDVYWDEKGMSGAFKSHFAIEGRGNLPVWREVNPAYKDRKPGYINGVFIHRSNLNGKAGVIINSEGQTRGISEGCLLIAPKDWDAFCCQLNGLMQFKLILNRK